MLQNNWPVGLVILTTISPIPWPPGAPATLFCIDPIERHAKLKKAYCDLRGNEGMRYSLDRSLLAGAKRQKWGSGDSGFF